MCIFDWVQFIGLLLSAALLTMNGVYTIWGLCIPKTDVENADREKLQRYIEKLDMYKDVISYSDAVMVPLNAIYWVVSHFCCKSLLDKDDDGEMDGMDVEHPKRRRYNGGGGTVTRSGGMGTFTGA